MPDESWELLLHLKVFRNEGFSVLGDHSASDPLSLRGHGISQMWAPALTPILIVNLGGYFIFQCLSVFTCQIWAVEFFHKFMSKTNWVICVNSLALYLTQNAKYSVVIKDDSLRLE